MVPEHYQEIDLGMSNFDHKIDKGFQKALISRECFGIHSAWNFSSNIYYKDGRFHEDV